MEVSGDSPLVVSVAHRPTKDLLEQLLGTLPEDKNLDNEKREDYVRTLKDIDWALGKIEPRLPSEVERQLGNFRGLLIEFDKQVKGLGKGSIFVCGSGTSLKQVDSAFRKLLAYEQMFPTIATYQAITKAALLANTVPHH